MPARNRLIAVALLSTAAVCAAADKPQALQVAVPAQPVATAINELARQSGLHIVIDSRTARGVMSNRVEGTLTAEDALMKLLENTGLRFEYLGENSVAVIKKGEPIAMTWRPDAVLVAQADAAGQQAAKGDPNSSETLEEVLVTAQRREENLQDVPISIAVFSGKELDASTLPSLSDALRKVPSLDVAKTSRTGGVSYIVRGVSSTAGSGPIAFYLDGVPYGFVRNAIYPDPSVYDLARVEFLSGPQGTLYGAGSLNGVVRISTHEADVDAFEFKLRTSTSMTEDGEESAAGDLAINVPLIDGVLGARAVAGIHENGGWIDVRNTSPANANDPRNNRDDVNSSRTENYRLRLRFEPTESFGANLTVWRNEEDRDGLDASKEDRTISALLDQPSNIKFTTYALELKQEFAAADLSSNTSYIEYADHYIWDGHPAGAPAYIEAEGDSKVFAQEVNLVSRIDGSWRWSVGAFYRDAKDDVFERYGLDAAIGGGFFAFNDYSDTSKSYAVYGELGRDLLPDLELAVGLRYFHDKATTRLHQTYSDVGGTFPAGTEFNGTSDAVTPRVILTWTPSADQTFYASYSQGFRSGFVQQPNVQAIYPNFTPVDPDRLHNFEIGNKGSLFGGDISYEVALFYIRWDDVQQNLRVPISATLVAGAGINGKGASGPGATFSISARPTKGLELGLNGGWSGLESDADILNDGRVVVGKGDRLLDSTEYTAGASARYEWDLAGGFVAAIGASANYTSSQTYTNVLQGVTGVGDDLVSGRAQVSIETPANWAARLFVDNFTDERGTTTPATPPVQEWSPYARPRTWGLQVEYRY